MTNLSTTQKFTVAVLPAKADGTPGTIDAPPTYPVDIAGVVTITAAADGLSAAIAGLAPGSCTITPTALAGGKTITGLPVQVTVAASPFATQLLETIGPVVSQ